MTVHLSKRRKVIGRYRMRAKKEVVDCSPPEEAREVGSTEEERLLKDTRASEQVETGIKGIVTGESRASTDTLCPEKK